MWIPGSKTGSCGILFGLAADIEQRCSAAVFESVLRRGQAAIRDQSKLDTERK